jgi:hypothetical protein
LIVNDILKVLYAPHRAFKEIIQNPRYIGAFVVLILFVAAQTGFAYTYVSKSYSEQTMPAGDLGDVWTENATLWRASPGVNITNNYADFVNGTPTFIPTLLFRTGFDYFGNSSIEFAVNDRNNIQMALSDLGGSVNCGADGFKNISVRIKLISPNVKPENVSLYLYSLSDSNFFYYDLTKNFSSSAVNVWNNITLPVGSGDWVSSNSVASWENITSLKMDFAWPTNSSIDLRVDGLFFRGIFKNPVEIYGSETVIFSIALSVAMQFVLQWLLLVGLMYVIIKGLKGNVLWKPLMVAVGFGLVTMVIEAVILVVTYMTLPNLYHPLEVVAGVPVEIDVAYQVISNATAFVSLVAGIISIAVYVWTIALGAVITRTITAFGWLKSILVSAAAFVITVEFLLPLLTSLLG